MCTRRARDSLKTSRTGIQRTSLRRPPCRSSSSCPFPRMMSCDFFWYTPETPQFDSTQRELLCWENRVIIRRGRAAASMGEERPAAVVFGATGNQGSSVLKHLYAEGSHDIYAVTRGMDSNAMQLPQVHSESRAPTVCPVPAAPTPCLRCMNAWRFMHEIAGVSRHNHGARGSRRPRLLGCSDAGPQAAGVHAPSGCLLHLHTLPRLWRLRRGRGEGGVCRLRAGGRRRGDQG